MNEGIGNFIIKKMIALVAGGDYRKAMKAAKGDKKLQKSIKDMNDSQAKFKAIVAKMEKNQFKDLNKIK